MKARDFRHLFGFRPPPQSYGTEVHTFDLPSDGPVRYAQWLHPAETVKTIRQDVVDELRTFLHRGDVAIDVGAHTGDSTIPIALAVGASGVVLALEPNPHVYAVLLENAQLNPDKTTIVPLNFAATPEAGEYQFQYSDEGYCNGGLHPGKSRWRHGHAFPLKVRGENLERYLDEHHAGLAPRLRYIKVDAEGADAQILKSLERVIARAHPYLRVEVHKLTNRTEREQLFDFLVDHEYEVFRIASETDYCGDRVGRRDLTRWRHYDIFAEPIAEASKRVAPRRRPFTDET